MKSFRDYYPLIVLIGILFGFAIYAVRYIRATSFVIEGTRYYNLFDDAMISMRYAWNLAHGNGLVWNTGERVEGFSNPLWVFFMAFWHLLPLSQPEISLAMQISGGVFLSLNLVIIYKIIRQFTDDLLSIGTALTMTAFYGPLNIWGLLGTEVSVLTFLVSFSVLITLFLAHNTHYRYLLYFLLGFSTLIRIDMVVTAVLIVGFLVFTDRQKWHSHLGWGISVLAFVLVGQTLLRYWYYEEWLPNTYTLKITGFSSTLRIARGIWVLFELAWQMNWVLFLLPLAVLLFRQDKSIWLLLLVFVGQIVYSTYVGGDAWEHRGGANRFISIAIPLWFTLFGMTVASIRKSVEKSMQFKSWGIRASYVVALILVGFSIWNVNFLKADYRSIERWLLQRKPLYVESHEKYIRTALILNRITQPGTKIAVIAAGTIPYYLPDRYFIDLLGKTDKIIAQQPIKSPISLAGLADIRPGHMKWDYAHSIGTLRPDVIVQLWEEDYKSAEPYLSEYQLVAIEGLPFYIKTNSPQIRWDIIEELSGDVSDEFFALIPIGR
ncbi:MAG: hypothetical protein NZP74_11385 [Anaerolineales bacterium]|nr:hypothetical protein [Anaerolineales bacterium]MDW8276987.1 hypothetical protein [Anaerolineales bacterium]